MRGGPTLALIPYGSISFASLDTSEFLRAQKDLIITYFPGASVALWSKP